MAKDPTPRMQARRRIFLDAASAAFLEKGYAGTTLDDVIARSGGSRQTLYAMFGGKQGLFEAIVAERAAAIFGTFTAETVYDRDPEEVLVEVGIRYVTIVTSPDAVGFYRLALAEGRSNRALAEQFWNTGPSEGRRLFARYFADRTRAGVLRIEDPDDAAAQFIGMLLGGTHLELLFGLRAAPAKTALETYVRSGVRRFLSGCREQPGQANSRQMEQSG